MSNSKLRRRFVPYISNPLATVEEILEAEIRAADSSNETDVELKLREGARFIQDIVTERGDALEELAKVALRFGANSGDRPLNIYLHTWIKLYLKKHIIASMPVESTLQERRIREIVANLLETELTHPYLEAMDWLNREYLLGDVVALGCGIVESLVLETAMKIMNGNWIWPTDIRPECKRAIRNGVVRDIAGGEYNDTEKIRILLVIGEGFTLRDEGHQTIEDVEEKAEVVCSLLKPFDMGGLEDMGREPITGLERWYRVGAIFAEACHQLAHVPVSHEVRRGLALVRKQPLAGDYLKEAVYCFQAFSTVDLFPSIDEWLACQNEEEGEVCSEAVDKVQLIALWCLIELLRYEERREESGKSRDILMYVNENEREELRNAWRDGYKDHEEVLALVYLGENITPERRLELMRLTRKSGATRFDPYFQLETVQRLAKLLNSPRSERAGIVDDVTEAIDARAMTE